MTMFIIVIIFVLIIIMGLFLMVTFSKDYKISSSDKKFFNEQLKRIISSESYKEQIIDIDKLYHKVLLKAGYKGTFGEILKSEPSEISNLQKIWELHKLRNNLVHDFNSSSDKELKNNAENYLKEIKNLITQFK